MKINLPNLKTLSTTVWFDMLTIIYVAFLLAPIWVNSGYGLSRDMVFTPVYPISDQSIGASTGLPRAVPLDFLLGLISNLVGGEFSYRLLLGSTFILIATGAHRLVRHLSLLPRTAVWLISLWNPFVLERFSLGQWALLLSLAAIIWLLVLEQGESRKISAKVFLVALGSITPTGGLVLLLYFFVDVLIKRNWNAILMFALALFLQLPWLVAGFANSSLDPNFEQGFEVFATQPELGENLLLTVMLGGGIWAESLHLTELTTWRGWVLLAILLFGLCRLMSSPKAGKHKLKLFLLAGAGLLISLLSGTSLGRQILVEILSPIPGAGMLRDGHKFLILYIPVFLLSFGMALEWLVQKAAANLPAIKSAFWLSIASPIVFLPSGIKTYWETVKPVEFPSGFYHTVELLNTYSKSSRGIILPWDSTRKFSWSPNSTTADPLPRWSKIHLLTADVLTTRKGQLDPETPLTQQIGNLVKSGEVNGKKLAKLDVKLAVVYLDQPNLEELKFSDFKLIYSDNVIALYENTVAVAGKEVTANSKKILIYAAHLWWLLIFISGLLGIFVEIGKIVLRSGNPRK